MKATFNSDLKAPETITKTGARAWKVIVEYLTNREMDYTGGCKAFFTGLEAEKYHGYKLADAVLVVHYDGGNLRYCFNRNWETTNLVDEMERALEDAGFCVQPSTNWASAIYVK